MPSLLCFECVPIDGETIKKKTAMSRGGCPGGVELSSEARKAPEGDNAARVQDKRDAGTGVSSPPRPAEPDAEHAEPMDSNVLSALERLFHELQRGVDEFVCPISGQGYIIKLREKELLGSFLLAGLEMDLVQYAIHEIFFIQAHGNPSRNVQPGADPSGSRNVVTGDTICQRTG